MNVKQTVQGKIDQIARVIWYVVIIFAFVGLHLNAISNYNYIIIPLGATQG